MRRSLVVLPVLAFALVATPVAALAAPQHRAHEPRPIRFSYLGETELPNALQFDGTTVGGLSAISWDKRTGEYRIISDDRSAIDPARFYTASIAARPGHVSVHLTGTMPFRQPDGTTYPPTAADGSTIAPDPEGIAVDPLHHRIAWSSEGERVLSPLELADPAVHVVDEQGRTLRTLALAPQLHMNVQEVGPRRNQTLEGLSYTPDGKQIWAGMEDPLYQDGENPTPAHGANVRITEIDAATGVPEAQFAYPLQPLFEPGPADSTNGLSDLAALGGNRFLVLERAFTTSDEIRVYEADASRATDVLGLDSLRSTHVTPMRKRLVVDLDRIAALHHVDNVEGITVGPRLPDGRRLVVLVSDDNFSSSQVTQFIAFAASGL